jgi:hypothetical protein
MWRLQWRCKKHTAWAAYPADGVTSYRRGLSEAQDGGLKIFPRIRFPQLTTFKVSSDMLVHFRDLDLKRCNFRAVSLIGHGIHHTYHSHISTSETTYCTEFGAFNWYRILADNKHHWNIKRNGVRKWSAWSDVQFHFPLRKSAPRVPNRSISDLSQPSFWICRMHNMV